MQYKGIITLSAVAVGISIPLMVVAYQPGIGYEAEAIMFMREPEWYGGVRTYYCNATASLSPFFYPISHATASPTVSVSLEKVLIVRGPYIGEYVMAFPNLDVARTNVIEGLIIPEILRNIPYYFAVASAIVTSIALMLRKTAKPR